MKGTGLVGAALLALAMMLVVIPTSAALAGKQLVLSAEGTPVANGSAADTGIQLGECHIFSNGTITENHVSVVKLVETTTEEAECAEEGETISGKINETQLKTSGKIGLSGAITISQEAGPCVYSFTKFKGGFTPPGGVFAKGETSGKLVKELSNPTKGVCEKKLARTFFVDATNEVFGEPFEAVAEKA